MSANIKQAYPLHLIDIALTVINNIGGHRLRHARRPEAATVDPEWDAKPTHFTHNIPSRSHLSILTSTSPENRKGSRRLTHQTSKPNRSQTTCTFNLRRFLVTVISRTFNQLKSDLSRIIVRVILDPELMYGSYWTQS
jgi:hypothetical protein